MIDEKTNELTLLFFLIGHERKITCEASYESIVAY